MRLLLRSETGKFSLTEEFAGDDVIPPYAILSHTWGADTEEVTFEDLTNGTGFSHNSARLASASDDRTVKIWDANSGKCLQTLQGHSDTVSSVAFSHDSTRLASASSDKTVKIWDPGSGGCLQTLEGHSDWVNSVAFSHDSARLASASDDSTVKIWDVSTGKCLQTLKGHSDFVSLVAFSHDSARLASVSDDSTVKIWDASSGECLQTLEGHDDWVWSIAFSHDSARLALEPQTQSSAQSTPFTFILVPQWNPIVTLNINQRPDGNFICSGTRNGTTNPCGWHIRGETASKISDLLEDISMLPPRSAIQSLETLANVTLCLHHKAQASGKLTEWTVAINRLISACTDKSDSVKSTWARESVFSIDMQANLSGTSFASLVDISATDAFAAFLIADDEIRSLCVSGIADHNVGPTRLERNLRRLLYRYAKDLSKEAVSTAQLTAVELFQSRSRLQHIANQVLRTVGGDSGSLAIANEPLDPSLNIQRYLHSPLQLHETRDEEKPLHVKNKEVSTGSSSSDDDRGAEINESRDGNLQSLIIFISNSKAFQLLKQNLQKIVFLNFSSELDRISQHILKRTSGALDRNPAMLQSVISQLRSADPATISVSSLHVSVIDNWKYEIEQLSGT